MGVYIPNMKMPEHCGVCRFAVDGWCYAYGKPNIDALANDGRTNFCPLVPVPPHGRLIDADALAEKIDGIWDCNDMVFRPNDKICKIPEDCKGRKWAQTKDFIECMVKNAPTVIEAEEGET